MYRCINFCGKLNHYWVLGKRKGTGEETRTSKIKDQSILEKTLEKHLIAIFSLERLLEMKES